MPGEEDWPLTDERIAIVLEEIRAHPCPRSACCLTDEERTSFALYIIGEKALADLLRLRAIERRMLAWADEVEAADSRRAANEIRSRVTGSMGGLHAG